MQDYTDRHRDTIRTALKNDHTIVVDRYANVDTLPDSHDTDFQWEFSNYRQNDIGVAVVDVTSVKNGDVVDESTEYWTFLDRQAGSFGWEVVRNDE